MRGMPPRTSTKPSPIDTMVTDVNRKLGEGTLVRGADLKDQTFPRVTSGSLSLDLMLGGGWPLNCWSELLGEPSNGKSVIAMKTIAANQARDPNYHCLWVAAEDFVAAWAAACGMDLDRVTVCQTSVMEDAYQVIIRALDNRLVDAVVVDSLSALVPGEEAEKTMAEWSVGLGARLTNKFMRKSASAQRRSLSEPDRPCLGIIISQWREKVGVLWGDNKTTPYGRGKEFHYMIRVETRRDEWITNGGNDRKVGLTMKSRAVKNKTAPPQRIANVDFYWEDVLSPEGLIRFKAGSYDTVKEVSNIALAMEVVTRQGAWYYYGDERWQGQAPFLQQLREEPEFLEEIRALVMHQVFGMPMPPTKKRVRKAPTKKAAPRKLVRA